MKLEPNMYVRTKYGIFKIRKITKDLAYWKHEKRVIELDRNIPECNYRFVFYKDESIFKGAKFKDNIMELIEVGDYVNGYIVLDITKDNLGEKYIECGCKDEIAYDYVYDTFYNKDIKTIVTKEQFESMTYKVV